MSLPGPCPFCEIAREASHQRIIAENEYAFLIRDGYPVSDGHSLVMPRRHIASFFETTEAEKLALLQLLDKAKAVVDTEYQPDAYNIGINDGAAAGQTVPHLHIHLIPRYQQQGKDPRGGVRWVVPEKADYWNE
jgi:diadenosine tetraphosphate (Ap4A) HIT family hydrolase